MEELQENLPIYEENLSEDDLSENDSNGDISDEDEPPEKKRKVEIWTHQVDFANEDELKQFLKEQNIWKVQKSNIESQAGIKTFYYCNAISKKKSGEICPAKLYSLACVIENEHKIRVFNNSVDHCHDKEGQIATKNKVPLSAAPIEEIMNYLQMNAKPRYIANKLRQASIERQEAMPTNNQVNFYCNTCLF